MSILVDDRVGSKELATPLQKLGLPVEVDRLPFGDVSFVGKGADDTPVHVGIELKKLRDMIGSLRTGRLAGHQAPGMSTMYDRRWIIVEGVFSVGSTGSLIAPGWSGGRTWLPVPGMTSAEFDKRIHTLEELGGFRVTFCCDRRRTVSFIANLYRWWTDKSLSDHATLLQPHSPHHFLPISDFRAILVQRFPGIGLRSSAVIEQHFGSLKRAVNASLDEWAAIEVPTARGPKRLGTATAARIVKFVDGDV